MDNPRIKNDFVNCLYGILLLEFSHTELLNFFCILSKRLYSPLKMAKHLADPEKDLLHDEIMFIYNTFQSFCISQGKDPKTTFIKHLIRGNGFATRAKVMKHIIEPFESEFLEEDFDAREILLKQIKALSNRLRPGTIQRLVKFTKDEKYAKGIQVYNLPDGSIYKQIHVDASSFILIMNKYAPLRFNAPPYDKEWVIAECQTIKERLIANEVIKVVEGILYINGSRYGKQIGFLEYLKINGYNIQDFDFPVDDILAIEVERDYFCPIRETNVLSKGCLYGTTCYMYGLGYDYKTPTDKQSLRHIISELTEKTGGNTNWRNVEILHNEFLEFLRNPITDNEKLNIVFSNNAVFIDGEKFNSGRGAQIIFYMLKIVKVEHRNVFRNIEVINSEYLDDGVDNGNFKKSLTDLVKTISKSNKPFNLVLNENRSFTFTPNCRYSLWDLSK